MTAEEIAYVTEIVQHAAAITGCPWQMIFGCSKRTDVAGPRHAAWAVIYNESRIQQSELARFWGSVPSRVCKGIRAVTPAMIDELVKRTADVARPHERMRAVSGRHLTSRVTG